ncbi:MAG: hypothetical protein ACTHKE_01995 [Sphingomicrobium sp.]|jgi:hypothetical protein
MHRFGLLTTALTSLACLAAAPPPSAPASHDDIVVLGTRNPDQVRRDYVRQMAVPSEDDQLARFANPVCPMVMGLRDRYDQMIAERLRKVAAASGMRVAPEKCAVNALVFIVADKSKLIEGWHRSSPEMFSETMTDAQIADLAKSPEPVLSWQILDVRGSDGRELARERLNKNGEGASTWGADSALEVPFALGSRYMNQVHYEFGASVVVIDAKAVAGADLRQLADFAAMQLFAHTDPNKAAKQAAPTILTLIQDAAAGRPSPLSLTEWDFAYLKSLYAYTDMYKAGAHEGELAKRMSKYMVKDSHL